MPELDNRSGLAVTRGQRHRAERFRWHAIDHELEVDAVVGELHEVDLLEFIYKLALKIGCVLGAHPEGDEGSDVAQNRVPDVRLKLVQVLVGDREASPVLPKLREHVDD